MIFDMFTRYNVFSKANDNGLKFMWSKIYDFVAVRCQVYLS